ncbi:MAG: Nre family DNA repair protein [Thermoproteota archaeon]
MPSIPPSLCIRCKGYKLLCGLPRCPILERFRAQTLTSVRIRGRELEGYTPPSAIVGEWGYPRVRVYYMVPPGEDRGRAWFYDAPREWAARRVPLDSIVALRSSLVSATLELHVSDPWKLYEKEISLAAVSERPVDSEALLKKPPEPRLRFDGVTKPVGPASPAEKVVVAENPRVPRPLEKILWDDLRAEEAVLELYRRGIDVYTIQRAMSLGLLGRSRLRKLVPTRWAITAVDDAVSRELRRRVRGYRWLGRVEVRVGEYLGNRFVVVLYPGAGTFEWIEVWHPRSLWTGRSREPLVWRLVENPMGRAPDIDGGFSAARLAVLEHLDARRLSADAIILREILPSYYAPVGNWQIRENVRITMSKEPVVFENLDEALRYALTLLSASPDVIKRRSPIFAGKRQTRLTEFVR